MSISFYRFCHVIPSNILIQISLQKENFMFVYKYICLFFKYVSHNISNNVSSNAKVKEIFRKSIIRKLMKIERCLHRKAWDTFW